MTKNTDSHIEEIVSEIDEPLLPTNTVKKSTRNSAKSVPDTESERLERQFKYADRMERHIYKKQGFRLLIGCLIGYGVLVIFDTIIAKFGFTISEFSNGFIELLKFVVSTLIGFVFSENLKSDKK